MNVSKIMYLTAFKHTFICLASCTIAHALAHPLIDRLPLHDLHALLQMLIMFLVAFAFSVPLQSVVMKLFFGGNWSSILQGAFWMSLITMITMMVVEHGLIYLTASTHVHAPAHHHGDHVSPETPPFFYIIISWVCAFCLTFYYNLRFHALKHDKT